MISQTCGKDRIPEIIDSPRTRARARIGAPTPFVMKGVD
jgi:hypothetical protein